MAEKSGLGGEDNALLTEGVDDRERLEMGTFKAAETTQAVREALLDHAEDFVQLLQRAAESEKCLKTMEDVERKVCPQSVMLLSEMFDHLFDYAEPARGPAEGTDQAAAGDREDLLVQHLSALPRVRHSPKTDRAGQPEAHPADLRRNRPAGHDEGGRGDGGDGQGR